MLFLTADQLDRMRALGAASYAHECCGALFGRERGNDREVAALFPLANRRDDAPGNRFAIAPGDFRAAEQAARRQGLDIIGWYHSHPDHPARPSEFDLEHAWPWYSYVIVSVVERKPGEVASWRLADDRTQFAHEEIGVQPQPLVGRAEVQARATG